MHLTVSLLPPITTLECQSYVNEAFIPFKSMFEAPLALNLTALGVALGY
jgi:hypothetical protein